MQNLELFGPCLIFAKNQGILLALSLSVNCYKPQFVDFEKISTICIKPSLRSKKPANRIRPGVIISN